MYNGALPDIWRSDREKEKSKKNPYMDIYIYKIMFTIFFSKN